MLADSSRARPGPRPPAPKRPHSKVVNPARLHFALIHSGLDLLQGCKALWLDLADQAGKVPGWFLPPSGIVSVATKGGA